MKRGLKFSVLMGILLFAVDAFGQGCSQCRMLSKQASSLDENSFGSNINTGILYLMIIPYILLMILFRKKIVTVIKMVVKR